MLASFLCAMGARQPRESEAGLGDVGLILPRRISLILWNGNIGGAEVFSWALAWQMRRYSVDAEIVFIEDPYPLATRIGSGGVPYRSLGLSRGRDILRRPRYFAREATRGSDDGVLLIDCGYMGTCLRVGGYGGLIIAVEHGDLLGVADRSLLRRSFRLLGRLSAAWADDAEVAVSDFVLADMRRRPHAKSLRRIYNGIEHASYGSRGGASADEVCVIAFAGRLVKGKGVDFLLRAFADLRSPTEVVLRIAGEGPERHRLETLALALGIEPNVEFVGRVDDMPRFWLSCDVAVIPSAEFVESCPIVALEAMAAGRPVIATRNGGLPEIVVNEGTGAIVAAGDPDELTHALARYVDSKQLRISHGASGRERVAARFDIGTSAQGYLELFDELNASKNIG
jgi:glycosyltransferase involved in cell wall biosynthesis